jgi:hypothetical protein
MKYKNKLKKLAQRQKAFDELLNKQGMTRPGSVKK